MEKILQPIKFVLAVFLFVNVILNSAIASTNIDKKWFIEAKFQKSIVEGTGWSSTEYDTPGSSSSQIQSTSSQKWNGIDASGIFIGQLFREGKISVSVGYENYGSSSWRTGQFTAKDGRIFDASEYPMKMHNFMVEIAQYYPLNENRFLFALAGVGQSIIKTGVFSKTLSGVTVSGTMENRRVENFSKRLGAGLGYKLSSQIQLVGTLQYSDYGTAETVGHFAGNNGIRDYDKGIFKTDVNAVEGGLKLRYLF